MRKKIHINWNWLVKETWFFHKGMVVPIVLAFWGSFHIRWNSQPISSRVEAPSSFYHQNCRLLLCFLLWIRLLINELCTNVYFLPALFYVKNAMVLAKTKPPRLNTCATCAERCSGGPTDYDITCRWEEKRSDNVTSLSNKRHSVSEDNI